MLDLATFTAIHTALSLVALAAGIVVVADLFAPRVRRALTGLFLLTAVATSATGFGFPFNGLLPSHILGGIALVVLAVAIYALYGAHLAGAWRPVYAVAVVASLFFLVFVGIVQAFGKIAALNALAPTGKELPVTASQVVALVVFIALAALSARTLRRASPQALGA
jgi:hypothetical protein